MENYRFDQSLALGKSTITLSAIMDESISLKTKNYEMTLLRHIMIRLSWVTLDALKPRMSHCPTYSSWIPEIPGGAHWNPLESSRNLVDFYKKYFFTTFQVCDRSA